MRPQALIAMLVLVAVAASADEAAPKRVEAGNGAAAPSADGSKTTPVEVLGDLPASLSGTWLVMIYTGTGQKDHFMTAAHVYQFALHDGRWGMNVLDTAGLPKKFQDAVAHANSKLTKYEPSADDLKAIIEVTPKLATVPLADRFSKISLRSADHFEKQSPPPAYLKEAKLSIELLEVPQEGQSGSGFGLYPKQISKDRLSGTSETAVVATGGGAVVPFAAPGEFVMHRLK